MRILIDADGCPVVDETIRVAQKYGLEVFLLCDTSHVFEKCGAVTFTFSKGPDSVDFALANRVNRGDLVITQDYGLAAMCLAKKAFVLHQDGMEYTDKNIDALLLSRYTAKKIRNSRGRIKGPGKRTNAQDEAFIQTLDAILQRFDLSNKEK